MKKLPYCRQCEYYGGPGKCNHPEYGGEWKHIKGDFWCYHGKFKEEKQK